jgi:DNA-binding transcriptional regulator YiaG
MARFLFVRGVTMKTMKKLKAELLANPAVRQAYDAQAPEFELARELIAARTQVGLTQGDVAALMGTTQTDTFTAKTSVPIWD